MGVLVAILNFIRWFVTIVWSGLGILAVIGYFTQVGDGLRERGLRSFIGNATGLLVVFVAPLGLLSFAGRRLR